MSFINQFLASLLEKFKTQQPKTYGFIALIFTALFVLANDHTFIAYFADEPWVPKAVEIISYIAVMLGGAHTSHITKDKV
jgi:hypothetical protein